MKLATFTPKYWPRQVYFKKLLMADVVVLLDIQPFSSSTQINRAPIKTVNGWQWITIPVLSKGMKGQPLCRVQIKPDTTWSKQHFRTILVNYKNAPFWETYADWLKHTYQQSWTFLIELNHHLLEFLVQQFHIKAKVVLASQVEATGLREQKVVRYLETFSCDTYVVESDARSFFDDRILVQQGFGCQWISPNVEPYNQQFGDFLPNLSVLDLLLNVGPYGHWHLQRE
ncbi:hypothetical protein DRQ12_02230 [candidate division KSB1 bacterium]|nr:MAG: hypothetical protein B5M50_02855 [candidate division KSB1 bacterium 4484_219]RKY80044.1 MAG: hypothetical protein DRQ12_02230 [candidate division KSB1 bacterium]